MTGKALILLGAALAALSPAPGAQPIALTDGPGDDTEAAWSPDGRRIVFQSTRSGGLDLHVLELASGQVTPLVTGEGDACYPAWSPDGRWVAYSYGNIKHTAVQGIENGYNIFVVPADGGEPRRLTSGVFREFVPTFSPDGRHIYFSSTRGMKNQSIGLYRLAVDGGEPEKVLAWDTTDTAFTQPDVSPDGRLIVSGFIAGFRSNWALRLLKADAPETNMPLTDGTTPIYGPRWSPDGELVACTGYKPSDADWGIYVAEAGTGATARIDTGPGNSRSPDWSPDGTQIVFESNRTGSYKLYRISVPELEFIHPAATVEEAPKPVLQFSFDTRPGQEVEDLSPMGNTGSVFGDLEWADGAVAFGSGARVKALTPEGLDFGAGPFSVSATILIDKHTDNLRLVAVGDYPGNARGWQIFLNESNCIWFNSRGPAGEFIGARTDRPAPVGRKLHVLGIRHTGGRVTLHLDGMLQGMSGSGASMSYGTPKQVSIGAEVAGGAPFHGKVLDLTVYSGILSATEGKAKSLSEFLKD